MTLNTLGSENDLSTSWNQQSIVDTRGSTAQKINDNLPKQSSMMEVNLYDRPLATLEELMKQ